jgi:hypothetical protein
MHLFLASSDINMSHSWIGMLLLKVEKLLLTLRNQTMNVVTLRGRRWDIAAHELGGKTIRRYAFPA